jgi:hypothetical protein
MRPLWLRFRLRVRLALAAGLLGLAAPAATQTTELLTPTEYLFANLGRAAGNAASAAGQLYADRAAVDYAIENARAGFHKCYPRCAVAVRRQLALALFARDQALVEKAVLRGSFGPGAGLFDALDALGLGGPSGGVNEKCRMLFDDWATRIRVDLPRVRDWDAAVRGSSASYVPYQRCRDREEIALAEAMR